MKKIANIYGCSSTTILEKIRRYDVGSRSHSEAGKISRRKFAEEIERMNDVEIKNECDPLQLAYIAGFFDGEGCVRLALQKGIGCHYKYRFQPVLMITQKDQNILEWIADVLKIRKKIYKNGNCYQLNIFDYPDLKKAIVCLKDYCKVKKPQLELLMQTIDILGNWTGKHRRSYKKGQILEIIRIAKDIRNLNNGESRSKIDLDELENYVMGLPDE